MKYNTKNWAKDELFLVFPTAILCSVRVDINIDTVKIGTRKIRTDLFFPMS